MAIRNASRWSGGQVLLNTQMNDNWSGLWADLAGRNGVIEYEDSLAILNGAGTRYLQLPRGTNGQRPSSPEPGYLRWNTNRRQAEFWTGSRWQDWRGFSLSSVATFNNFNNNSAVGDGSSQISSGNHVHPPVQFSQFSVSPTSGTRGTSVSCVALATTSNGKAPRYRWSVSPNIGTFNGTTSSSTTWTMPRIADDTTVTITCRVDDQEASNATRSQRVTVTGQLAPVITIASVSPVRRTGVLTTVNLRGTARDPDGDSITYAWSVSPNQGAFTGRTSASAVWTPPIGLTASTAYGFTLRVSDGLEFVESAGSSEVIIRIPDAPTMSSAGTHRLEGHVVRTTNITYPVALGVTGLSGDPVRNFYTVQWSAPNAGDGGAITQYDLDFAWTLEGTFGATPPATVPSNATHINASATTNSYEFGTGRPSARRFYWVRARAGGPNVGTWSSYLYLGVAERYID